MWSRHVYEEFVEKLLYKGDQYEVSLPWKATHPPLPENFELTLQRFQGLLSRLREKPEILKEYDSVNEKKKEKKWKLYLSVYVFSYKLMGDTVN